MANKIDPDVCISCGACESECPNSAISQGDSSYVIDPKKCDECKARGGDSACKSVCPSGAIGKA
jgi:ferredoxin